MKRTRGFTLIELMIVVVIMTILIGGLAMPLSAQIQARRIGEDVRTRLEGTYRDLLRGPVVPNPAHPQAVGHDHSLEAHLAPQ